MNRQYGWRSSIRNAATVHGPQPAAITVAFSHLLFNLSGMLVVYLPPPVRALPLLMARSLGDLGARNRTLAAIYIVVMFYGLPVLLLFLSGTFDSDSGRPEPESGVRPSASIEMSEPQLSEEGSEERSR